MVDVGRAVGYLDLDTTGFKKGFSSAINDLKIFNDKSATVGSKFSALGSSLTSVGSTLTKSVTVPLVGAGAVALKFATDFEKSLSGTKAVTGATGEELKKLKATALELGSATSFSAKQVAAGMTELGSAGFSVNEILDAMPGLLDLAAASGTDLAVASEISSSALRGFGLQAKESGRVADIFARAAADTNANVIDMGEAMKYVAPVASSMGLSIEETAAAIGILSNAGIKGGQAGTVLRGSLSRLVKPSKEAADMMEQMSFSAYDSQGNMKSLDSIINDLKTGMSGMTEQQKQNTIATLFGQEAMSGMLVLLNSEEGALNNLTTSLENSSGAAKEMADTMLDNTAGSIEELMGSLETLAISLGDLLIPMFRTFVEWLTKVVNSFNSLDDGTKKTIVTIAGIATAIGPVMLVLGKVISTVTSIVSLIGGAGGLSAVIAALTGPIGWVVAAIAALVIAWQTDFGGIRETTEEIIASLTELFTIWWEGLVTAWETNLFNIRDWWDVIWTGIEVTFTQVLDAIQTYFAVWVAIFKGDFEGAWNILVEFWGRTWERLKEVFLTWWNTFSKTFMEFWTEIEVFFNGIWDSIVKWFQDAWNNIILFFTQTVPAWIDSVIEWFKKLPYNLGVFVGEMIQHILNFGKSVWGWVTTELPKIIQNIIDWFAKLPSEIWKWLLKVVDNIITWGKNAMSEAGKAATNIWNAIIDWFKKLPKEVEKWFNDVLSFLGSLPATMLQIGKDIIGGLWDGLKNMWDSVYDWFNDIFTQIGNFFTGVQDGMNDVREETRRSDSPDYRSSNASGLDYVPYNGYIAQLHEGEKVLTAQQAKENNSSKGDTYNFYSPVALTPIESAREMKKAKQELTLGFA